MRANPGYAPEALAGAAVAAYGPVARAWAERVRGTYPGVTAEAVARLAAAEHTRYAACSGAVAALGGLLGPLAAAAGAAVLQARLALHIAAAYGADPTDPERAVDLLMLTRVHPDAETARAALTAAAVNPTEPAAGEPAEPAKPAAAAPASVRPVAARRAGVSPPLTDALWRVGAPMIRILGAWAGRRAVARLVPGAALVLGATADGEAMRSLAARAMTHYRGRTP